MSLHIFALTCLVALGLALPMSLFGQNASGFRPSGVNILDITVPEEETRYPWLHGVELVMDPAVTVTPDGFEAWFRANAKLDPDSKLEPAQAPRAISQGLEFVRLEHWFKGLRVLGEEVLLMVRDGRITSAVVRIHPRFTIDPDATIGEAEAVAIVTSTLTGNLDEWVPGHPAGLILDTAPGCELAIGRRSYSRLVRSKLQYLCTARVISPTSTWSVVLDGESGEVLKVTNTMQQAWLAATATGDTIYAPGFVSFPAEKDSATNKHQLISPKVHTLDAQDSPDYETAIVVESPTSNFGTGFEPAVTAHFGGLEAITTFQNRLGADLQALTLARTGFDRIQNVVNWDDPVTGFFVDRALVVYGQDPANPAADKIDLDAVGHEYAHALADYSLPPFPSSAQDTQYGSIHEGFADIMGEVVELDILGTPHNWITGVNLPNGPYRDHRNPSLSVPPQPDVYAIPPWVIPGSANYNPHTNGSILALWMNLLVEGCAGCSNSAMTPYSVDAIGLPSALKILFTSLQAMPFLTTYPGARNVTNTTVRDMCGEFSLERRSVHNAWYAVGLNAVQINGDEHLVPADGTGGVLPWPAELKWQAGQLTLETDWQLQISKDPNFPPADLIAEGVTDLTTDGAYQVGRFGRVLDPDTLYYWRVKKTNASPDLECWRPTRSFTTNDQIPTPWHPTGGEVVHPWVIDFAYSEVPGATEYEIQISEDNNFPDDEDDLSDLIIPPQFIPTQPNEPDQTARITVPKNKDLFWRVRAHYKPDAATTITAGWSQVEGFAAVEPEVILLMPPDQVHTYPWPILFQWDMLLGATFEFTAAVVNGGHHKPVSPASPDHWLFWYQNADGMWTANNDGFEWWVTAKGPPWGSELTPMGDETREDAKPSPHWTTFIGGDTTETPITVVPAETCYAYGDSVDASWPPIPDATHYEVQLHNQAHPNLSANQLTFLTEPAWNNGESNLQVRAMHQDKPSVAWSSTNLEVRSAKPVITYVGDSGDVTPVTWTTSFAGSSSFTLEAYEELNCGGSLKYSGNHSIFPNDAQGTVFSGQFILGDKKRPKSFRVRSFSPGAACASPWSNCAPFSHAIPEPPADPNVPTVQCGDTILAGSNTPLIHILDFGQTTSGQVQLKYDHYCVPDTSMVRLPGGTTITSSYCTGTGTLAIEADVNQVQCQHGWDEEPWTSFSNVSHLVIKVIPNCLGFQNTLWTVQVDCQLDP